MPAAQGFETYCFGCKGQIVPEIGPESSFEYAHKTAIDLEWTNELCKFLVQEELVHATSAHHQEARRAFQLPPAP